MISLEVQLLWIFPLDGNANHLGSRNIPDIIFLLCPWRWNSCTFDSTRLPLVRDVTSLMRSMAAILTMYLREQNNVIPLKNQSIALEWHAYRQTYYALYIFYFIRDVGIKSSIMNNEHLTLLVLNLIRFTYHYRHWHEKWIITG